MGKASRRKISTKELQKKEAAKKAAAKHKTSKKVSFPVFSMGFLFRKVLQVFFRIRWVLVGIIVLGILVGVIAANFFARPSLVSLIPQEKMAWLFSTRVSGLSESDKSLPMWNEMMQIGEWNTWEALSSQSSLGVRVQTSLGSFVAFSPKFRKNLWPTAREKFPGLPETCEENALYEINQQDTSYYSFLCSHGYLLVSAEKEVIAEIQSDMEKPLSRSLIFNPEAKNKNVFGKNLEIFLSLQNLTDTFQKEYEEDPFLSMIPKDVLASHNLHTFGRLKHGHFSFDVPLMNSEFSILNYSIPPQPEAFLELAGEGMDLPDVPGFFSFFEQTTGMDLAQEMKKIFNIQYHLAVWRDYQEERNDYVLVLFAPQDPKDLEYYHAVFQSFVPAQAPVKREIILPDGTKGAEWVIDTAEKFEITDTSLAGYACKESRYEQKNISFITCLTEDMTVLATSKTRAEQLLSSMKRLMSPEKLSYPLTRGETLYWKERAVSYEKMFPVLPWDFLRRIQNFELRPGNFEGSLEPMIQ